MTILAQNLVDDNYMTRLSADLSIKLQNIKQILDKY